MPDYFAVYKGGMRSADIRVEQIESKIFLTDEEAMVLADKKKRNGEEVFKVIVRDCLDEACCCFEKELVRAGMELERTFQSEEPSSARTTGLPW